MTGIFRAFAARWEIASYELLVGGEYYDGSWTVLSLLMLSGNFLDYTQPQRRSRAEQRWRRPFESRPHVPGRAQNISVP